MSAITGKSIITRAATLIQDSTGVRWPRLELLDWLNDGQREVVLIKPEACVTNTKMLLTAGKTKQAIPDTAIALIDVTRNMGIGGETPGDAIRLCSREVLDSQLPSWHSDENTTGKIVHYMFDPRDPKTFYIYPKAPATPWYVDLITSSSPANTDDDGAVIGVDDIYANALLDYVLYRAYSKDATFAQNANLAVAHYTAFSNSLGVKSTNDAARNPNLAVGPANPNVIGAAQA